MAGSNVPLPMGTARNFSILRLSISFNARRGTRQTDYENSQGVLGSIGTFTAGLENASSANRCLIARTVRGVPPSRDHRINPRVIKSKMLNLPKKRPVHNHIQHSKSSFGQAVRVLK